ncbi:MAG: 6,7-dimethyl-8-ribityllumazine synthase [Actinomycetaceae bacterium]|nr:6,7-dimethyl-8-ribityllumazine synthase [Actinomycetaceae bacterium]MDU0970970.1 6,7-dimethyl-8-ribityllumazine synthase [Actinomycetaceae bacterium]
MSASGAPTATVRHLGPDTRVTIVAASWHEAVMDGLVDGATRALTDAGVTFQVVRVPGTFELPVVTQSTLANGADAAVALGVVIRGGTPHFDYVCDAATYGLTRVALTTGKPVGFGVLTCDDEEQALARAGLPDSIEDKGYEAAAAALETLHALAKTRGR